jgi:hypothetical protein
MESMAGELKSIKEAKEELTDDHLVSVLRAAGFPARKVFSERPVSVHVNFDYHTTVVIASYCEEDDLGDLSGKLWVTLVSGRPGHPRGVPYWILDKDYTDELLISVVEKLRDYALFGDVDELEGLANEIRQVNEAAEPPPPSVDLAAFLETNGFNAAPIISCFDIAVDVDLGTHVVKLRNDTSTIYGGRWIVYVSPSDPVWEDVFRRLTLHVHPTRSRTAILRGLNLLRKRALDQLGSLSGEIRSMGEAVSDLVR